MKIYICDDEEKLLQDLSALVRSCCLDSQIQKFSSGIELIKNLYKQECDILLLDIDMPDMNGMEAAQKLMKLQKKPILVFVTSHDELVYESFLYHPFGFIRKRFYKEELPKLLQECMEELKKQIRHFCFRRDGKDFRLLLSEIFYFEADGNYLKVFTKQGLRTGEISHGSVLGRAMFLCREKTGQCNWPDIPEEYWKLAVEDMI